MKMKKYILPIVFVLTGLFIIACDKKDDKDLELNNALTGTTWTIISDTGGDFTGLTVTFKTNGTLSVTGFEYPGEYWGYTSWSLKGSVLTIVLGEDGPDDYIKGNIEISGNDATYDYSWYDYFGEWGGKDYYHMILKRK